MADTKDSAAARVWEFRGTRAMLEAEANIPAGTDWPKGAKTLYWEDGAFRWSLGRTRPDGLEGPMKLWTSGDWWNLRCDRLGPEQSKKVVVAQNAMVARGELSRSGVLEVRVSGPVTVAGAMIISDRLTRSFEGSVMAVLIDYSRAAVLFGRDDMGHSVLLFGQDDTGLCPHQTLPVAAIVCDSCVPLFAEFAARQALRGVCCQVFTAADRVKAPRWAERRAAMGRAGRMT